MGVAPDIGDTPGSGRDGLAAAGGLAATRRLCACVRVCVRAHVRYGISLARHFTWRESFSALPP
jgi:hypothetical protein